MKVPRIFSKNNMVIILFSVLFLIPVGTSTPTKITYGDNYKQESLTYTIGVPTFYNGTGYESVDTTLQSNGSYVSSNKNKFKSSFNKDTTKNDVFKFEINGAIFTARPYSITTDKETKIKNPVISVHGNTISYENIFDYINLNYTIYPYGIKEDLILSSKPITTVDTFIFSTIFEFNGVDAYIGGQLWDKHSNKITSSDIEFKKNDTILFKLNKPFLIDNSGNVTDLTYLISKKGNDLVIDTIVPMGVLNSAVYPVRIDPTITITNTNLLLLQKVQSLYGSQSFTTGSIYTGRTTAPDTLRSLIKWNISTIPANHNIESAIFTAYQSSTQSWYDDFHKITSVWDSGVTWNTQPTYASAEQSILVNAATTYNIGITNMVRDWYNGTNYGMLVKANDESTEHSENHAYVINAFEPYAYISININNSLSYPTNFKTDGVVNNLYVTNTSPTFTWSNNDNEADTISSINIQVHDAANGAGALLWNNTNNSAITSIVYAGSALTVGQTYYVRIKINDIGEGDFYEYVFKLDSNSCIGVCLENWIFDLKNGAYITIPSINATNFTNTVSGELEFWLNGSKIQWRTGSNKTISNVRFNNVTDAYSFNASGTNGYLNFTSKMNNNSYNYTLYIDGTATANIISNSSGIVTYNFTGTWSNHIFIVNTSNATANATTDNFYIYLDGVFQVNSINPYFNATGLLPVTNYSIGVRSHNNTYDTFGGWVNSTITTDAENGSNYDTASGTVRNSSSGLPISSARVETTQGIVWTDINGLYSYGSVFLHNTSYEFNISKTGYASNITIVNFTIGDNTVHDVSLVPYPPLVSWTNNFTNNNSVTINITEATNIQFSFSSDQLLTSCVWTGIDTSEGYNGSTCTAYRNVSTGYEIVTGYGSNSNGSTPTITWVIAVPGLTIPSISSFISDVAGASEYIQVASGTPITFTVTAPGATSFTWYIDHKEKAGHTSSYIYTPTGYHTISVIAQNGYGDSNMAYKNIIISQLTAIDLIPDINTSDYDTLENLIDAPDLVEIINFVPSIYTHFMGNVFYLILWALVFLMIWIRSDKMTVPTVLGFIIGGAVIGTLPAQYQLIAQVIIVSGLFAALFIMFKEKR